MKTRRETIQGILAVAGAATVASGVLKADQPHMKSALSALQSALSELQAAKENKAGHRMKAIGLVKNAIEEVEAGMAAAS